jgi:hypothetical protein
MFDAKKHEILVVKTQLVGTRNIRELYLIKSGDDLDRLLCLVPESYHAAIRNSKECVVQLKWAQLLYARRCYATISVVVRMPRHRTWSDLVPLSERGWAMCVRVGSAVWTDEEADVHALPYHPNPASERILADPDEGEQVECGCYE